MLKIGSNASVKDIKKAADMYLELIRYEYCNEEMKNDYNYMQGLSDAIAAVERELDIKF